MQRRTWQTLGAVAFLAAFTTLHFFALRYCLQRLLSLWRNAQRAGAGQPEFRKVAPLKIFVYDIPERLMHRDRELTLGGCPSSFYSVEGVIPQLVKTSPWALNVTQTKDALDADYFLIPHYGTCHYNTCLRTKSAEECQEGVSSYLTDILDYVEGEYPFWSRRQGADHVIVLSWDWGSHLYGNSEGCLVRNRLAATIQLTLLGMRTKDGREVFDPHKDISIPPLRDYRLAQKLLAPPEDQDRTIFAYFRGTVTTEWLYSRGIRPRLVRYGEEDPAHYFVRQGHGEFYWHELRNARFALCPAGWSHWSPRLFDAIVAGAIPVIIADEWEPAFSHSLVDYEKVAIRVAEQDLERLTEILLAVTPERQIQLRREMSKIAHRFVYNVPSQMDDAVDSIMQILAARPRPAPLQTIFGDMLGGGSDAEYSHGDTVDSSTDDPEGEVEL